MESQVRAVIFRLCSFRVIFDMLLATRLGRTAEQGCRIVLGLFLIRGDGYAAKICNPELAVCECGLLSGSLRLLWTE